MIRNNVWTAFSKGKRIETEKTKIKHKSSITLNISKIHSIQINVCAMHCAYVEDVLYECMQVCPIYTLHSYNVFGHMCVRVYNVLMTFFRVRFLLEIASLTTCRLSFSLCKMCTPPLPPPHQRRWIVNSQKKNYNTGNLTMILILKYACTYITFNCEPEYVVCSTIVGIFIAQLRYSLR